MSESVGRRRTSSGHEGGHQDMSCLTREKNLDTVCLRKVIIYKGLDNRNDIDLLLLFWM